MVEPRTDGSRTKKAWASSFNDEAAEVLREYMKPKKAWGAPLLRCQRT